MTTIATIAAILAAVGACVAAWTSVQTVQNQTAQEKTALWRSLSLEFSYKLRRDRQKFGAAYLREDALAIKEFFAPPIMQFFETMAFLVNHQRIDDALTRATLWDSFSACYVVTKSYWEEENKMDSEIYQEIKELVRRWGLAPWTKNEEEMKFYFQTESNLSVES